MILYHNGTVRISLSRPRYCIPQVFIAMHERNMDESEKSQTLCEGASLPYATSDPVEYERQWCRKEK